MSYPLFQLGLLATSREADYVTLHLILPMDFQWQTYLNSTRQN